MAFWREKDSAEEISRRFKIQLAKVKELRKRFSAVGPKLSLILVHIQTEQDIPAEVRGFIRDFKEVYPRTVILRRDVEGSSADKGRKKGMVRVIDYNLRRMDAIKEFLDEKIDKGLQLRV